MPTSRLRRLSDRFLFRRLLHFLLVGGLTPLLLLVLSALAYAEPAESPFTSLSIPSYQQDSVSPLQGELPVRLLGGEELTASGVSVRVEAVPADRVVALSPMGLAFRLRADSATEVGAAGLAGLQAEIDYSRIVLPYGGSVADRLMLVRLSNCHENEGNLSCTGYQPLSGINDRATRKLTVDLTQSADAVWLHEPPAMWPQEPQKGIVEDDNRTAASDAAPDAASGKVFLPIHSNGAAGPGWDDIYVLAANATSGQGDYTATPLSIVSDYQVGLFTGAAQTSQSIPVPPAPAGAAPDINMVYNSGAVDGMNHSRNSQPSWVGIGWELESGYITRHMRVCGLQYAPGDFCIPGDEYSITLNGTTSRLVKESGQRYRLRSDPYWIAEKFSDGVSANPDSQKEYWIVTTPDGTQYRFGGEIDPETGADQNSVWYASVYNTSAALCGNFLYDLCDKAWRWNLDRVEDTNGNLTTYYYATEINYYAARGSVYSTSSTWRRDYVRGGTLTRIEYGRRVGSTATPPTRIEFVTEERCEGACAWPSDYPDTPGDLACTATASVCWQTSQSFWSRKRLNYVKPQIYNQSSSSWQDVARYNLTYDFPDAPNDGQGDGSESKLFLTGFSQQTADGSSSLPGVDYEQTMLPNRRNYNVAGVSPMYLPRISKITTELGGEIEFTYGQSHPCPVDGTHVRPPYDCFIAYDAFTDNGGYVWWQKWKVMQMTVSDNFSGNAAQTLNYAYSTPTWHYWEDIGCTACSTHLWNDFRGHAKVTVTDAAGAKTEYRFYQGMDGDRLNASGGTYSASITLSDNSTRTDSNWLTGLAAESRQLDANSNPLTRTVHWYTATATAGSGIYGARFVASSKVEETLYGTVNKTTRTEYEYDSYGNPTREILHGDISTTADDRFVATAYLYNTAAYIVDRPQWRKLWAGLPATGGSVCQNYVSSDVPKSISSSGTPSVSSSLSVGGGGSITDVNVTSLHGTHTWINDLDFNLISPDNTVVEILGRSCNSEDNFNIKLDDGAASGVIPCPPTDGQYYKPSNPLSAFNGKEAAGTWQLRVDDNYTNDGGSLNGWALEICTAAAGNPPDSEVQAYTAFAYDGQAIGVAPIKGNATLTRGYWGTGANDYAETQAVYDGYGRPTTVTDAEGRSTTTAYHAFYGYAQRVTNALNQTVDTVVQPGFGVPTQITDANGKVTELAYDDFGRLTYVWLPSEPPSGPASLAFSYAPAARPAYAHSRQLMDAAAGSYLESWGYVDGFGREIQSQRPSATPGERLVSSTAYNNVGLTASSAAPYALAGTAGSGYVAPDWSALAGVQVPTYDALARVVKHETRANGVTLWETVTAYDGWTVSSYDANGHRTDRTLDAFGQLVQVVEHNDAGGGPVTYTTHYSYDLTGNLTGVTDHHGNVTSMSYDLLGRKTAMTDPDMGAWQYQYDAVGNLTAQRDGRGQWLHLGYDSLNRLTAKRRDAVDGPLLASYVYDTVALGQLYAAQAYDGAGNVQVETRTTSLDDRYRATAQEWIVAGQGVFRLATAYNAADQVTSLTYPADNAGNLGEVVVQGYNAIGQLTNVTGHLPGGATEEYVASALYSARGQLTALASGNGLTRQYDYAPDTLRLTHIRAGMGTPWIDLQSLSYTYDASGNILTLTDGANSGQMQSFGYDWLDRLVSASTNAAGTGQYSHTYAYDAIGNITSLDGNAYAYSSTQPHAVTSAHGNSYGYDASGNQTSRIIGGTTYTVDFDDENRLTVVKQGGTVIGEFVYDASGNRIKGTVNGVTTVYIGGVYEWQAGGGTTSYYRGPGGDVAFRRTSYASDNGVYYLLRDHLGSSSVIVDGSGSAVKRAFYYPFGGNRGSTFSDLTTKRFTGQYHEEGLPGGEGLSYYNARWYDAQLGRFISADTIVPEPGNPQALNRYAYVINNPLRLVDPSGHAYCIDNGCSELANPQNGNRIVRNAQSARRSAPSRAQIRTARSWLIDWNESRRNASPWSTFLSWPTIEEPRVAPAPDSKNLTGWLADQIANHSRDEFLIALSATNRWVLKGPMLDYWAANVATDARWDFKSDILREGTASSNAPYIQLGNHSLHYEVVANIFYGYMGRSFGFSKTTLTTGAGIAQIEHGAPHWARNFVRAPRYVGDEHLDGWAVDFGYYLYEQYGDRPGLITAGTLTRALDTYIARHPVPSK